MLGAVYQYADADYCAPLLIHCCHNLTDRAASGKNVIDNKNSLARVNAEASPEGPFCIPDLFCEYTTYT